MSSSGSDQPNEGTAALHMDLLAWWAAHLAEHEAAGNKPLLILAGVGVVWGLWFSLRCPGTSAEIGRLLEGTAQPPPDWLSGALGSAQLDPLWPLTCFQMLQKGKRLEVSPEGRLDVLFGPLDGQAEAGRVLPAPTVGPETLLQQWAAWHQDQWLDEPRTVLLFTGGTWRMWASLGIPMPLSEIVEQLLEPRPDRPDPSRLPLDLRWRGGTFPASDLCSAELVMGRALAMRSEASPWLHVQLPEVPRTRAAEHSLPPEAVPDPKGIRARRTLELLIAAVALYQRAELDGASEERFGAVATIGLGFGGPLFPVVREDFRRYVAEQLGAAAPLFWKRVQAFVESPCHDAVFDAAGAVDGAET